MLMVNSIASMPVWCINWILQVLKMKLDWISDSMV